MFYNLGPCLIKQESRGKRYPDRMRIVNNRGKLEKKTRKKVQPPTPPEKVLSVFALVSCETKWLKIVSLLFFSFTKASFISCMEMLTFRPSR